MMVVRDVREDKFEPDFKNNDSDGNADVGFDVDLPN